MAHTCRGCPSQTTLGKWFANPDQRPRSQALGYGSTTRPWSQGRPSERRDVLQHFTIRMHLMLLPDSQPFNHHEPQNLRMFLAA